MHNEVVEAHIQQPYRLGLLLRRLLLRLFRLGLGYVGLLGLDRLLRLRQGRPDGTPRFAVMTDA